MATIGNSDEILAVLVTCKLGVWEALGSGPPNKRLFVKELRRFDSTIPRPVRLKKSSAFTEVNVGLDRHRHQASHLVT